MFKTISNNYDIIIFRFIITKFNSLVYTGIILINWCYK